MKYTVDRIEADVAVLEAENGSFVNVPLLQLPENVRDGSVLLFENGVYKKDTATEEKRRSELYKKQQMLLRKK